MTPAAPTGADLFIFTAGSCRSITRAATGAVTACGTTNVSPYARLNRMARSRASSRCWRWSSPTGTAVTSYIRMSAAISTG